VARMSKAEAKPFAVLDSNVIVYAMADDVSGGQYHQCCLQLVEKGFKGELDYLLAVNPVIVVEVFSALRRILSCNEAESRVSLLLRSRRIVFLPISKEECQRAIQWAKEKNIPVNDALIAQTPWNMRS
jgi:predicted nucleic acid-binding protein